jgi:hypothetical protein
MYYWIAVVGLAALAVAMALRQHQQREQFLPHAAVLQSATPATRSPPRRRYTGNHSEGGNLCAGAAPHPGEKPTD